MNGGGSNIECCNKKFVGVCTRRTLPAAATTRKSCSSPQGWTSCIQIQLLELACLSVRPSVTEKNHPEELQLFPWLDVMHPNPTPRISLLVCPSVTKKYPIVHRCIVHRCQPLPPPGRVAAPQRWTSCIQILEFTLSSRLSSSVTNKLASLEATLV